MKTNIALIGFMGVGKSTVGKLLAARLGKKFIEVDTEIEQQSGKSIPQIFQEKGEIGFRELEIETIKEISRQEKQVIACGGGAVLNKINIDRLKQDAVIIWLTASPDSILKRTHLNSDERPVLKGINDIQSLESLMQFRLPYYERSADMKIETTKLDLSTVVEQIIVQLKDYAVD